MPRGQLQLPCCSPSPSGHIPSPPERVGSIPIPPRRPWWCRCLCPPQPRDALQRCPGPPLHHHQVLLQQGCSCRARGGKCHRAGRAWRARGREGVTAPPLLQRCPAEPWVRARSCHTTLVTLPWSPLLPAGRGKGGSGVGARDAMGTSSIVGTAAPSPLQRLCQASLPPPRGDQPWCHGTGPPWGVPACPQCHHPYVPFRALTLATRSWKPWAQRLGTSSSTISIFRPV